MRDLCIRIKVLKSEFKISTGDFYLFLQTCESFKPFKGISTLIFLCTIDVSEHHLFDLDNAIKILSNARCIMRRLNAEFGKYDLLFQTVGKRTQLEKIKREKRDRKENERI